MKYLLIALVGFSAYAADTGQTVVGDPAIGSFIIRKTDNLEPAWHPLLYTLSVKCKGDKEARVLKKVKICRMLGHTFDESSKNLEVVYEVGLTESATISPCAEPETSKRRVTYKNLNDECGKKP